MGGRHCGRGAVTLSFRVLGVPVPQGNHKPFVVNGRAVMAHANAKVLHGWREAVANAAREAHAGLPPYDGALRLRARFVMPRPKSARKAAHWQPAKPDYDKLARALGDSLTIAGVIRDDARIVDAHILKVLADLNDPWTGADVELSRIPNGEPGLVSTVAPGRARKVTVQGGLL